MRAGLFEFQSSVGIDQVEIANHDVRRHANRQRVARSAVGHHDQIGPREPRLS